MPPPLVNTAAEFAQRLKAYRAPGGVVLFASEALRARRPSGRGIAPLQLEQHQRQWLLDATTADDQGRLRHTVAVASWPKREGKSMCVAILLAYRMTCRSRQESVILANSREQAASNVFDELLTFFELSPALGECVTEQDIQRRSIEIPRLHNETVCVPCNFRTVQGRGITGILAVDELHAVQDVRAYNYLRGQTESIDAQTCISSQAGPAVKDNPVWRLYQQREQPHILFNYLQEHVCDWAIRLAEQQQTELTDDEYRIMHRNAWGGLGSKLFSTAQIDAAELAYAEPTTREEWLALIDTWGYSGWERVIGAGLDRSGHGADRTVWVVIVRFDPPLVSAPLRGRTAPSRLAGGPPPVGGTGNPELDNIIAGLRGERPADQATGAGGSIYRIVMVRVLDQDTEADILDIDRETREIFGNPDAITLETYQAKDLEGKIRGAQLQAPTSQQQQLMFGPLWRLFRDEQIGYPTNAGNGLLRSELAAFEYIAGMDAKGNRLSRYGTQSGHDDTVYSLAHARCAAASVAYRRRAIAIPKPQGL